MQMVKQSNGLYTLKNVIMWTTGRFRGFGSPAAGDNYSPNDLKQIVRSHYEVAVDPRFYYGHPLNPTLAMLSRPKGNIQDMRVSRNQILGDIINVPHPAAKEAIQDNVRLSPDMKMNYLDPGTGKTHKWLITGLAMLGGKSPGNKLIPGLGDQLQLDPDKFYSPETEAISRSFAAEGMRSFTLDFTGRFPGADPRIIQTRSQYGQHRSFLASDDEIESYTERTTRSFVSGILSRL